MGAQDPVHNSFCPYCGCEISPPPKANRKCPSCGERLLVRTRPADRVRVLCTEEQAAEIDGQWAKHYEDLPHPEPLTEEEDQIETLCYRYRFTEDEWNAARAAEEAHAVQEGLPAPSIGDIVWGLGCRKIQETAVQGDWHRLSRLYWAQAMQIESEGRGDPFEILYESQRWYLEGLRSHDQAGPLRIRTFSHACSVCKALKGKVYSVEDATREMPLPVRGCTGNYRCCTYELVQKEYPTVPCRGCGRLVHRGATCRECGTANPIELEINVHLELE